MGFDGVLNGFFFDFLWVSLHGGGGCVVAMVVSLIVVANVGFMVVYVGFICVDFCFDFLWVFVHGGGWVGCCHGGVSYGFFHDGGGGGWILVAEVVVMSG